MAIRDSKRGILTKIGGYSSYNEIEKAIKPISSFASVNNKKDPIEFLVAVLGSLVGTEAIKIIIGNLISKFIDDAENVSKSILKKQFNTAISNNPLPSNFINDGINVPIKNIDSFGKFKIDRNSNLGSILYEKTETENNFDNDVYKAILNNNNNIISGNLILKYDKSGEFLNIKPKNSNTNISEFFGETIDNYQILNKREIVSMALNKIFGTVSLEQNKPKSVIIDELKFDASLEKFINDEDNIELNNIELNDIEKNADNLKQGLMINDLGCGIETKKITVESIQDLLDDVFDSENPIDISNKFDDLIKSAESNRGDETVKENLTTTKDNFFKKLINFFRLQLVKAITFSPLTKTLFMFSNIFNGVNGEIKDNLIFLKENKSIIKCIVKELISILSKFIYDIVIIKVLNLVRPIIKKILRERINSYVGIIKSLIKIPLIN